MSSKYTKWDIKAKMPASKATTPSDEALVMWLLHCHAETWQRECTEESAAPRAPTGTQTTRKRKRTGPHMSSQGLAKFKEMLDTVQDARTDEVTGTGWEEALMAAAVLVHEQNAGGVKSGFTDTVAEPGTAVAERKKIHMPYISRSVKATMV